jgi:hypothetical protein
MSSAPVVCLPYVNACGAGVYCNSNHVCSGARCVPIQGTAAANATAALPPNAPPSPASGIIALATGAATTTSSLSLAGGVVSVSTASGGVSGDGTVFADPAGLTPQAACQLARAQQPGCSDDATPLLKADAKKLGYAVASREAQQCFESASFKCCASAAAPGGGGGVTAAVHGCKGQVILESAVSGIFNGTVHLIQAVAAGGANATAASGVAAAGGPASFGGGSGGNGLDGGPATAAVPMLQPMMQGLAAVVRNVSVAMLGLNTTANGTVVPRTQPPAPALPGFLYANGAAAGSPIALGAAATGLLLGLLL